MDFTNAAILAAAAYGAVFLVLVVIASIATGGDQDRIPAWVKVLVCVLVSIAVVFLVANSEWGSTQLVDGHRLDQVSFGGLLLVGLFLSFLESAGFLGFEKLLDGLRNTGQNQLTDVQRQALGRELGDRTTWQRTPLGQGAETSITQWLDSIRASGDRAVAASYKTGFSGVPTDDTNYAIYNDGTVYDDGTVYAY